MALSAEVEDCWARVTAWLAVNAPVSSGMESGTCLV